MKARMSIKEAEPRVYEAMAASEKQIAAFHLDLKLKDLIKIRASQLNGCGYCINMHAKDARKHGETEQRIYALSAWWETPFFTEEEQAVLKVTEAVTLLPKEGVPDAVFKKALDLLGEQKLAQVIFIVATINTWNRIAVSTHMVASSD